MNKTQRITEQDAREIIEHYLNGKPQSENHDEIAYWLDNENGRTLLAQLNEHREPDYKAQRDLLLATLHNAQNILAHCKADLGYSSRQTKVAIEINAVIAQCEGKGDAND